MPAICAMPVPARGLSQVQKPADRTLRGSKIAINRHLGEIRSEHVGERFQDNRNQRNPTCQRYGRRYFNSRTISRLS